MIIKNGGLSILYWAGGEKKFGGWKEERRKEHGEKMTYVGGLRGADDGGDGMLVT